MGHLQFAVFQPHHEKPFGPTGNLRGVRVAVGLRRGAHEHRIALPLIAGVGVFVAVKDEHHIVGFDGLLGACGAPLVEVDLRVRHDEKC